MKFGVKRSEKELVMPRDEITTIQKGKGAGEAERRATAVMRNNQRKGNFLEWMESTEQQR